jgi:DNA-binding transcriptional LysR family regulator
MELRQLRAFVEVAEAGHFGHAAEHLHLTQPALTQRIQALERELGLRLLERNARGVRLAPSGTVLLPHARRLIQTEDQALGDLRAYLSGIIGRLRIAYQAAGDIPTAASLIAEYRQRFPAVEVDTVSGSSGPNLQLLEGHAVDAAFCLMPAVKPDGIASLTIRREEVGLAVRADHPLAEMDPVPVERLRGEPMGLPPAAANPNLIGTLRRWLVRHTGDELNVVSEDPTDLAMQTVAKSASAAILIVLRYAPMPPPDGIVYRSLSPAPLIEFGLAYRSDDPSPIVANMVQLARELAGPDSSADPMNGEMV